MLLSVRRTDFQDLHRIATTSFLVVVHRIVHVVRVSGIGRSLENFARFQILLHQRFGFVVVVAVPINVQSFVGVQIVERRDRRIQIFFLEHDLHRMLDRGHFQFRKVFHRRFDRLRENQIGMFPNVFQLGCARKNRHTHRDQILQHELMGVQFVLQRDLRQTLVRVLRRFVRILEDAVDHAVQLEMDLVRFAMLDEGRIVDEIPHGCLDVMRDDAVFRVGCAPVHVFQSVQFGRVEIRYADARQFRMGR